MANGRVCREHQPAGSSDSGTFASEPTFLHFHIFFFNIEFVVLLVNSQKTLDLNTIKLTPACPKKTGFFR